MNKFIFFTLSSLLMAHFAFAAVGGASGSASGVNGGSTSVNTGSGANSNMPGGTNYNSNSNLPPNNRDTIDKDSMTRGRRARTENPDALPSTNNPNLNARPTATPSGAY